MGGPDMDYEYEDELNEFLYVYENTNKKHTTKDLTVTFTYSEEMTEEEITDNIHKVIEKGSNTKAGKDNNFISYSLDILEVWKEDNEN